MQSIGLVVISVGIALYGLIPLGADLSSSHAFNPRWPAHARFHVVSQVLTNFFVAVVAMILLWVPTQNQSAYINLSVILSFCVIGCFFLSAIFWGVYRGKLKKESGNDSSQRNLGGNALVFGGAGVIILVGLLISQYWEIFLWKPYMILFDIIQL